jgi:hypothetical protein
VDLAWCQKIDHYAPLLRAVASLDRTSYEARGAIYDRALAKWWSASAHTSPPRRPTSIGNCWHFGGRRSHRVRRHGRAGPRCCTGWLSGTIPGEPSRAAPEGTPSWMRTRLRCLTREAKPSPLDKCCLRMEASVLADHRTPVGAASGCHTHDPCRCCSSPWAWPDMPMRQADQGSPSWGSSSVGSLRGPGLPQARGYAGG